MQRLTAGLTGFVILLLATTVLAADWNGCHDDLDALRRRASDASDAAEQILQAADELDTKRRDLQDCKAFPDIHDLLKDGCQSQRSEYESARSEYQSAKDALESDLDDVDSAVRSASGSCSYSFGSATVPGQRTADPLCRVMQKYKGRSSVPNLLEMCKKSRSEQECRKCLE